MKNSKLCLIVEKIQDMISKPLRTRPLAVFSILAFIFMVLRLYYPIEPLLLMSFYLGLLLIWLNLSGKINNFITVFICLSIFLGMGASTGKISSVEKLMSNYDNQFVRVKGRISSIPDTNKYETSFYFDCDTIKSHKGDIKNLKILVRCDNGYEFKYGEILEFNANLYSVETVNIAFSQHYLSKGAPLVAKNVTILDKRGAEFPQNILSTVRNYFINIGNTFFKRDARELFKALTAGDRTGFSDELNENLRKSGLSHVACVSGLHVSILGLLIYRMLKKRNKYLAACFSIAFVYVFAFVTGASPSTMRAAMMFTGFMVAKIALRDNDSFTALCFSAFVLGIINPFVIYDWGFILSFLSVLGIQIFSVYIKNLLDFLPEFMSDAISVTISAQLLTMPAVTNMFGYLSVYSILSNLVVSSVFIVVLYSCFIFIFASFIPGVNCFGAIICTFLLDIIAAVANLFADMPMSVVYVDHFDVYETIVYFTLVLIFVFRKKLSAYIIGTVMIVCALILIVTTYYPDGNIQEYSIDDNSSIILSNNKAVLIANDSLVSISDSIDDFGRDFIDDVIITTDVINQESGLIDMRKIIGKLHVSETYKNSTFVIIARRMGREVRFYSDGIAFDEYALKLLE